MDYKIERRWPNASNPDRWVIVKDRKAIATTPTKKRAQALVAGMLAEQKG